MGLLTYIKSNTAKQQLDISNWKKFKLSDLFEITGSKTTPKNNLDLDDTKPYPYVTTQATNNGIFGFSDIYTEEGGILTVDSAVVGTCLYQEKNFTASDHVEKLIPKFKLTKNIALFLTTLINKSGQDLGYSYGKKRSQTALKNEYIYLPVTPSGEPDWEYMESYIAYIYIYAGFGYLKNLSQHLHQANYLDTTEWKEFKVKDVFYRCELNKKKEFNRITSISIEQTDEFNLPLVNAKHYNNGIMYYGRECEFDSEVMTLDIVQNGAVAVGDVFAQPQRTGVFEDAYLIKSYELVNSKEILLFLATVLKKCIKKYFSYDNKCTWNKVKEMSFLLPVKNNVIDWEYMENYIRSMYTEMKQAIV